MGEVERVVSDLMQVLEAREREAIDLVNTMHRLQDYLERESKNIVLGGLDRLLTAVREEAARITRGTVVVLISPEGTVTVNNTYSDDGSDSYLKRLKSQGFYIRTLSGFSYLIQLLKSQVAEGNLIPVIEFLKANAKIQTPFVYSGTPPLSAAGQPPKPSTSSPWKLSDFLTAPFPHPPFPRLLFKD